MGHNLWRLAAKLVTNQCKLKQVHQIGFQQWFSCLLQVPDLKVALHFVHKLDAFLVQSFVLEHRLLLKIKTQLLYKHLHKNDFLFEALENGESYVGKLCQTLARYCLYSAPDLILLQINCDQEKKVFYHSVVFDCQGAPAGRHARRWGVV